MRQLTLAAIAVVLLATCSSPPAVIPSRTLERPVDMTFVCLGMVPSPQDGSPVLSGQTMDQCHDRAKQDPIVNLNVARNLGTFGFVINSSRGELAVADMDIGRLLDLSPQAAGYGLLPVGGNPEAIASSPDGAWVVTANKTTCDFTLVDPARLLVGTFSTSSFQAVPATAASGKDVAHRLVVQTGSGRALHTSTGEVAFLPTADGVPRAVATFPTCDLVALLEFSFGTDADTSGTATIASSFYVRSGLAGGSQAAGTEPVCPTDCAESPGANAGTDAGTNGGVDADGAEGGTVAFDGGTTAPLTPLYLQPLALKPDGTRVYVGSLTDTAITSFDISDARLSNPNRLELAENPIGVTRIRLSVDPYGGTGTIQGKFLGTPQQTRGQFLYAFTRDDSVRVVEVEDGAAPQECDVNIIATPAQKATHCFPVGSSPRRPLAHGPGIRIPTFSNPDTPPPLPRDLAFADLQPTTTVIDANYQALSGQFGFLLASNGVVYVINLDPLNEATSADPTITATHSFRELRDVGAKTRTEIAVSIAPQRSIVLTDQAFATTASFSALDGPLIQAYPLDAGGTPKWFDFPDPDTIISRNWDVVWEGVLPNAARESGKVEGAGPATSAGILSDAGADFCTSGVRAGDVLMFPGCTQNSDCQPDDKFTCQPTVSGANSMCLPVDGTASAELIQKCSQLMGSRMRYQVVSAGPTKLVLGLKLDEVPKTALNPCIEGPDDSDCQPDADHKPRAGSSGFKCLPITHPQDLRCVEPCDLDSQCRAGHVCADIPGVSPKLKLCVEAPPIDPTCFSQPMTRYRVQAGQSYMVYGDSLPSPRTSNASGATCVQVTSGDPSLVNRIPLSAPGCSASFLAQSKGNAAALVQTFSAERGSNPCLYRDSDLDGSTTTATPGTGAANQRIHAFFQNPQIRFVLTNLDTYAGDLLSIHFQLQYGFTPLTVQSPPYEVLLTLGTRILTGPTKTPESPIRQHTPPTDPYTYPYLYVVDQGRTALTPASRGQVLRINPRAGSSEFAAFDTTVSGNTPFQLQ